MPSNIGGAHWGGVADRSGARDRHRSGQPPGGDGAADPARRIRSRQRARRRTAARRRLRIQHDARARRTSCGGACCWRRRGCRARRRRSARWSRSILKTGGRLWEVPLGSIARADRRRRERVLPEWGSPNLGGPIVTAGGLVFIGAALDRSPHAFDIETGRELWRGACRKAARRRR